MVKSKYVGTTYDVFLRDTRTKDGEETSITLIGNSKADVVKQAKSSYKSFMKITKVKFITRNYREV